MSFWADSGLLNSKEIEDGGTEENAPLWTVQYLLLNPNPERIEIGLKLSLFMSRCFVKKGLYNQRPEHKENHEDYTSPDQLIAFICGNILLGRYDHNNNIWGYLWKHLLTYDNLTGKINFGRIIQPLAITVSAVAGSKVGFLFRPLLSLICIYSCLPSVNSGETSGRLKAWTVVESFNLNWTRRILELLIEEQFLFGWEAVFRTYFPNKEHPIRKMTDDRIWE